MILRCTKKLVDVMKPAGLAGNAPRTTVTSLVARELAREELPADTFGELETTTVALAKTADRSILGGAGRWLWSRT